MKHSKNNCSIDCHSKAKSQVLEAKILRVRQQVTHQEVGEQQLETKVYGLSSTTWKPQAKRGDGDGDEDGSSGHQPRGDGVCEEPRKRRWARFWGQKRTVLRPWHRWF